MTDLDGKRDFLVSFNKADRTWATWIAGALEAAGYSVFFQDWDFKGNFVLEMDRAHKLWRRTIAVLSPDYLAVRFTAPEWAARFAQDATGQHDSLIPVRVRECELEGLLAQIVYVDLVGCDEAEAKKRLLDRVTGIRMKLDDPPLYPSRPAVMHLISTPKTIRNGEISALAVAETLAAMAVAVLIAVEFGTLKHIAVSACVAPFLLLRTERSRKPALDWGDKVAARIVL